MILPYLEMISPKWHELGILLGVSHENLAKIHGEPEECVRRVISLWLSGCCSVSPKLESLTGALRSTSIQENNVADAIEQGQ